MGLGFVTFFIGFATLFGLFAVHGALGKSRQFGATSDLASGRLGGGSQVLFFLAFALLPLGACGMFAGVAMGDSRRGTSCRDTCHERGYREGRIQGSKAMDPKRPNAHAFVACACSGGASPDLEINSAELE